MTQRAKLALLTGAALMAAGAAAAQAVDDYGVKQPATGVTGIGVNEAEDPQVIREGGYIPPAETARRLEEGSISPGDVFVTDSPASPAARTSGVNVMSLTPAQLDDADLVNESGMELGEVEAVLLGPDGDPAAVLVELDDDVFGRERLVEVELSDLHAREAGKYRNIWSERIELVTDQPLGWFEAAHDWADSPRFGGASASR